MAVTDEEWVETLEWCEEETARNWWGSRSPSTRRAPRSCTRSTRGNPSSTPRTSWRWPRSFHVAGEDWTFPSGKGWDDTNLAMFISDAKTARMMRREHLQAGRRTGGETDRHHRVRPRLPSASVRSAHLVGLHAETGSHPLRRTLSRLPPGRPDQAQREDQGTHDGPGPLQRDPQRRPCGKEPASGRHALRRLPAHEAPGQLQLLLRRGGGAMPMGGEMKKYRLASGKVKAEQIARPGQKSSSCPATTASTRSGTSSRSTRSTPRRFTSRKLSPSTWSFRKR
jgi:hypothetical protein